LKVINEKRNTSGLNYKHITIVNDASRFLSEQHYNEKCHLRLPILLLETSILLLESIYSSGITHNDRHMTIVILQLQYVYSAGLRFIGHDPHWLGLDGVQTRVQN
jgi:hypothetical protein